MKLETDINRFIEAQEVPYFFGYKQALQKVKNGRKANIGHGTYIHNSDVWDEVVGYCKVAGRQTIGTSRRCDKVYA